MKLVLRLLRWGRRPVEVALVAQQCPTLRSLGLQPARLLCPWDSPGKNTGVDCHSLLQNVFLIQGSNPSLLHCRLFPYRLSYMEDGQPSQTLLKSLGGLRYRGCLKKPEAGPRRVVAVIMTHTGKSRNQDQGTLSIFLLSLPNDFFSCPSSVTSVMSNSVGPYVRQPSRLLCPRNSPGKRLE